MSKISLARGLALVSHGPLSEGQWKLETVNARELQEDEVLIRVLASGICLADIHVGDAPAALGQSVDSPVYYPRVLGHEGSIYFHSYIALVIKLTPDRNRMRLCRGTGCIVVSIGGWRSCFIVVQQLRQVLCMP